MIEPAWFRDEDKETVVLTRCGDAWLSPTGVVTGSTLESYIDARLREGKAIEVKA